MAQFFDDFSSYDSGSLLPQNPNYVSETDPQIDASDRLNFTATTHFGSGDAIIYIGLGSSETIEVFAEAISNSSRPGVCALNSFDLLAPYLGYATSRVTDVNTELRFANESSTDLYANGVADGAPAGVSINIRYRISKNELSQYVIRYKAWIVGDDEPVGWLSEYVDTRAESPTGPLYPGVFLRSGSGTTTITNKFGVGTDGDAAPTEPVSGGTVQYLTTTGINSAESFGQMAIAPGATTATAIAITSNELFGTPDFMAGPVSLQLSGIPSEAAVSELVLYAGGSDIFVQAIDSESVVASPELVAGSVSIELSAIPSEESVSPMAFYAGGSAIFAHSIAGVEQFGDASFMPGPVSVSAVAIASESIVSSPEFIAGPAVIYADSVPSAELFGDLTLFNVQQLISLVGITTDESFGSTTIEGGADLSGWLTGRLNIKPALTASVGVNRVH